MRPLFSLLSPAGDGARLQIFIFHRVLPRTDPLFPGEMTAERFGAVCGWLRRWFDVLPLDQAVRRLRVGTLPARAAAITFDDGYADNHDVALPILRAHGLPATFFVATGFLDGGRMWNDSLIEAVRACRGASVDLDVLGLPERRPLGSDTERRRTIDAAIGAAKYMEPAARAEAVAAFVVQCGERLPDDLMMRADQVRALHRAGMQIGAHTVNHPILARMEPAGARDEIDTGRRRLEAIVDDRVGLFAYPNGKPGDDYLPLHAEQVRALGFDAAVCTAWGAAHAGSDPFQLPRFTPWDLSRTRFGLRLARTMWASRKLRLPT